MRLLGTDRLGLSRNLDGQQSVNPKSVTALPGAFTGMLHASMLLHAKNVASGLARFKRDHGSFDPGDENRCSWPRERPLFSHERRPRHSAVSSSRCSVTKWRSATKSSFAWRWSCRL